MGAFDFPSAPDEHFQSFLRQAQSIEGERLAGAIPKEYFEPRIGRGAAGFAVSWLLYAGAIAGVAWAPHRLLWIPLWIVAGLGGWGLHCIAHDCGHGSFSRSRRLNHAVGHVSLLPLIYPFHAWRHVHNMHHGSTNHLELDTDWRPLPAGVFDRMPLWGRALYVSTRTWAFWAGTVNYWIESGFRPGFYPKAGQRREVRRSMAFVAAAAVPYLGALVYFTGPSGLLRYFVAPWLATHAWFSATTLMHHSASDVPYLTAEHWTRNAGRLLVTTDYVYPRWLLFLTHNISLHTAHHVAPVVPFYNLPKARQALKERYPGLVRERKFTFGQMWRIIRHLHFYDTESGFYTDLSRSRVPTGTVPSTTAEGTR
ncbi:fatty acid desaturase [Streptomyces somaliensis]|uniref:fatty acid desaturase n=1 Tax=Streptomyces somaliensis TaxID=78355 RepID=UPI0020CE1CA6|nr:fatty acid desaturase [Streptomyces somaliensis]MCP9943731.1 fatty acid desaturase [Streptomyces somaliensis]